MRITTQMLNETSKRTGIPVNQTNLLSYINNSGSSDNQTLVDALNKTKEQKVSTENTQKYKKLQKEANSLQEQAAKFAATGEDSFFDKIKESGDHETLYSGVMDYVKSYNSTLSALKQSQGVLNEYYSQMMQEAAKDSSKSLEGIGITIGKDGLLSIDEEKLKAASVEDIESVLGVSGQLSSKIGFLAGRVSDHAQSGLDSVSQTYSGNGSQYIPNTSKFDLWG